MTGTTQRGYKAGLAEGKSMVEMVNLFYQNDTAAHFYKGLTKVLKKEFERRELDLLKPEERGKKLETVHEVKMLLKTKEAKDGP